MNQTDKLNITVSTVANGYTLDFLMGDNKQGYMYFTREDLVEGFIYHVGLLEMAPAHKGYMTRLLKAMSIWTNTEKLIKKLLRLEDDLQQEQEKNNPLKEQIKYKSKRVTCLMAQNKSLREKLREYVKKERTTQRKKDSPKEIQGHKGK
jgi:hypothetical protein